MLVLNSSVFLGRHLGGLRSPNQHTRRGTLEARDCGPLRPTAVAQCQPQLVGRHAQGALLRLWLPVGPVKDDMTVEDLWPKSDPIRRQLLGYAVKPMVVTRQRTMTSHCVSGCVNTAPADSL